LVRVIEEPVRLRVNATNQAAAFERAWLDSLDSLDGRCREPPIG